MKWAGRLFGVTPLFVLLALLAAGCGGRVASASSEESTMSRTDVSDAWLHALMRNDSAAALSYIDTAWKKEHGAADMHKLAARAQREHWRILRTAHDVRGERVQGLVARGVGFRLCAHQKWPLLKGGKLTHDTRNVAYDWKVLVVQRATGWHVLGTRPFGNVDAFHNCAR